jgi:hypothetical protein
MYKRIFVLVGLVIIISSILGCFGSSGGGNSSPFTPNFNPNFSIASNINSDAVKGKPGISFDGTNFICVWQNGNDIYGTRVSPNGTVIDNSGIPISIGLNESTYPPSVCFDGTNYFVTWCATRSGIPEIYGARVTSSGQVLDPNGIKITTGSHTEIRMPGIAFDGINFLIVWRTQKGDPTYGDNIYGAIVSKSGVNLSPSDGFPIANLHCSYYPSVAFDGTNYMVVWHDSRNADWDIYGARVDKSGTVLDQNGFLICNDPQNQEHCTIAFDGSNYLVVWYDWRQNNDKIFGSAYGARVSPSGIVLDQPAFKIADHVRGEVSVQVAFDGTNYLAIWGMPYRDEGTNWRLTDVYGRRISKGGQFIDKQGIPISTSFGHQFGPIVGYGGGRYLIAWSDGRNYGSNSSIYGQILRKDEPAQNIPFQASAPVTGNWTQQTYSFNGYASEGLALAQNNAYLFGNHEIVHFLTDQWHFENQFPEGYVYAAWANTPDNIWIGGWAGGINHFDGQNWNDIGCKPGMIITGIWGSDNQHLWASTDKGHLLKMDNSQWNQVSTNIPFDLEDIWGSSSNNIYTIGEQGSILHYNGANWNLLSGIPTNQTLNAIWGFGPNDIFVVGDWGTILHFNGSSWSLQETCTTEHLFDVWGFNGSDVYAVGLNGTILHFNGVTWQKEDNGTDQDLLTIIGTYNSPNHFIWAAGSGNIILYKEY